jgi:ribosome biogenesis ATPase
VYQIARKLSEEQQQYGGSSSRLSVPAVYEKIRKSNSSLNRKNKKLLEDSIERVLEVIKDAAGAEDEESSIEVDLEGLEDTGSNGLVCQLGFLITMAFSTPLSFDTFLEVFH